MIDKEGLEKIKHLLESSQNPLFFFDNDVDGLCSFLILRRAIDRGKGVAIKSFPDLSASYVRKVHELKPDMVFILDKPLVDPMFIEEVRQLNIPIVWIDHHQPVDVRGVDYFNPSPENSKPTTFVCYEAVKREKDKWIALLGCLADWYMPDFSEEIEKTYPDLFKKSSVDIMLYKTELGKLVKLLSFALKDRTSNVTRMLKFLCTIETPYDLLKDEKTKTIYRRFEQINRKYVKLIEKARQFARTNLLYFQYAGSLSLSSDIANELLFLYPEKIIVVVYIKGEKANISLRGRIDVRELAKKAMKNLKGGTSGGHKNAAGATLLTSDLKKFHRNLLNLLR